jgi:tetratricopeptide (TPR) repeat protein
MNGEVEEYKIQRLNLLAFPRNGIPVCELTGERANVELVTQFITLYYISEELAEQAWLGIIKKIAHLLSPLVQPAPIVGTQEERNRRANNIVLSKRSLIEFCLTESSNLLSVQKYQLAFPAAIQALKFCKEVDGERSVTMVEPYLQLSQASLGLKEFSKAEEYLALARWIVLNTPECSDKTRSRLHMLKGRVGTAEGNFDAAKPDFADGIYYASRCYGAESIVTSIGYFRLGDVFLAQGNVECALAFFDKVVDVWYKYLSEMHTVNITEGSVATNNSSSVTKKSGGLHPPQSQITNEQLTEENLAEGRSQLEIIFEQRKRLLGNGHIATGEVQYTLGLFEFFLLVNETNAESFIVSALHTYEMQLGQDHPSTRHVSSMLALVQHNISDKLDSLHSLQY